MRGLFAAHLAILAAGSGTAQQPSRPETADLRESVVYDSHEVIERAIARKRETLAGIGDLRYDSYVKFSARVPSKPQESAESILLITETRGSAYWETPGHYQETILARRQSSNLDPGGSFVIVGDIVNFNRDRIDLQKYSLLSPIADDALEYYDYAILDTLEVDEKPVLRLAVRPRTEAVPLFVGTIDVAASTYEVLAIDVGVNAAARFTYVDNLRYQQRVRRTADGRWMPYEVRLTGEMHQSLPVPGVPRNAAFEHVAWFDNFRFDQGGRPPALRRVKIVVDEGADDPGSTTWDAPAAAPLTAAERAAWARIDSIAKEPNIRQRIGRALEFVAPIAADPDFFRFNRVDGPYIGAAREWRDVPVTGTVWTTKAGHAFRSGAWQYRVGGRLQPSRAHDLWAGASYHDGTMRRPTFVSATHNPTLLAFAERLDPLDYYRERGLTISGGARLLPFTRLELRYHDVAQSSLTVTTNYALLGEDRLQRPNPPIVDGRLRSIEASLSFDSRPLLRSKGVDYPMPSLPSTRLNVTAEVADPTIIKNDFSFRHFTMQLERRQRTLNVGVTTARAVVGVAIGDVPPQRYFTVDFGPDVAYQGIAYQGNGFNTLEETNFSGNRAAMLIVHHDFDRLLFQASSHPLVRSIPFTLSLNGGLFWTDFVNHAANPADSLLDTAHRPYIELGFGVGNLTPFLSPFNFDANLTWQLSSHPTQGFQFGLDLTP